MGTGRQACHKAGQAQRQEKKGRKKKMWVHLVCNWECRRRLRYLKQSKVSYEPTRVGVHKLQFFSSEGVYRASTRLVLQPNTLNQGYICVEIYTHPRISQCDFPVMHFVALQQKSKKKKVKIIVNTYTKRLIILLSLSFHANLSNKMHSSLIFYKEKRHKLCTLTPANT